MKLINKISLSAILMAILFAACQKDNVDVIIPENPEFQPDTIEVNPLIREMSSLSSDYVILSCLKVPFPIEFLQASGNTITINSEEEWNALEMLADSIVDFVYPFEAEDDNGVVLITNIEDLVVAITNCSMVEPDCSQTDPHILLFFNGLNILTLNRYVYTINYPVTLIVEGNQVVITSDDEYLPAVGGSPFNLLETELVYPITVTQFGREIVLNSNDDVCQFHETLDEPCENKPTHIQFFFNEGPGTPISCTYFIDYPLEVVSNGDIVQIQSRDEYINLLNSSPTVYDDLTLVFPVSAFKFFDGQQLSFEAEADICQYLNNCQ